MENSDLNQHNEICGSGDKQINVWILDVMLQDLCEGKVGRLRHLQGYMEQWVFMLEVDLECRRITRNAGPDLDSRS